MTLFINVYKADDNFVTSGAKLLSDLYLQETYRAIDSVALVEYLLYPVLGSNELSFGLSQIVAAGVLKAIRTELFALEKRFHARYAKSTS